MEKGLPRPNANTSRNTKTHFAETQVVIPIFRYNSFLSFSFSATIRL